MDQVIPVSGIAEVPTPPQLGVGVKKRHWSARLLGWAAAVLVIIAAAAVLVLREGWYQPYWQRYQRATVALQLKEGGKFAIDGATVTVNGQQFTSDATGQVSLGLTAGSYKLAVSKAGYKPLSESISLNRGSNGSQVLAMQKLPDPLYSVTGYVHDSISNKPLVNVSVTLGSKTVATNPNGEYQFSSLAAGNYQVKLHKASYTDTTQTVTLKDADVVQTVVPIVPVGRVLFVSNRDGRRGLYTTTYSGSDTKRLVDSPGKGEDFAPVLSPDGKHVAFSSTRDNLVDAYGAPLTKLYTVELDGSNLHKVSDTVSARHTPVWSPDSKWLYDEASVSATDSATAHTIYSVARNASQDLGEAAATAVFSPDSTLLGYSVFGSESQAGATPDIAPTKVNFYDLKTYNLLTSEHKQVARKEQQPDSLQFSPNASALSYEVLQAGTRHRYSVLLKDGSETEIPVLPAQSRHYVFSPNGKLQAFIEERDGKRDLYTIDSNGNGENRLTTTGNLDSLTLPVWDQSGQYLMVMVHSDNETALYVVASDGGPPIKVTDATLDHP